MAGLQDLPPDLQRYLSAKLPRSAVANTSQLSRATQQATLPSMRRLCDDPEVSQSVLTYLQGRHSTLLHTRTTFFAPGPEFQGPILFLIDMDNPEKYKPAPVTRVDGIQVRTNMLPVRLLWHTKGYTEQGLAVGKPLMRNLSNGILPPGSPDPRTLLAALRLRKGCRTERVSGTNAPNYGLDLVREYIRSTLAPYLDTLLGTSTASRIYDTSLQGKILDNLLLPVLSKTNRSTKEYQNALGILYLLSRGWMTTDVANLKNMFNTEDEPTLSSKPGEIIGLVRSILTSYTINLPKELERINEEERLSPRRVMR